MFYLFFFLFFFLFFCSSEEETYPVEIQKTPAKIGKKTKMVTCFTYTAPAHATKQSNQARRHTISGLEIHDKDCALNLRNDLLRSFAQRRMSLQKIEEETKPLAGVSYNKPRPRRRSTLVTDVLTIVSNKEHEHKLEGRKSSLVSDVIKFDPRTAGSHGFLRGNLPTVGSQEGRRDSLEGVPQGYQGNSNKPNQPQKLEFVASRSKKGPKVIPDSRQARMNEISKLRYTSAARAAKMAFREAHVSMKVNRRLSLQATDHYVTMKCVERIFELQGTKIEEDGSSLTKLKNWQKKFKMALNEDN